MTNNPSTTAPEWKLMRCGQLIDIEERKVHEGWSILIKDDVIEAIGPSIDAPSGALEVDASDRCCMPGLMEMRAMLHHHATMLQRTVHQSSASNALATLRTAQALLELGFTTVRVTDMDRVYESNEVRDAINRGDFSGPRLIVAQRQYGEDAWKNMVAEDLPFVAGWRTVAGTVEIQKAVRRDMYNGADWISVFGDCYSLEELKVFAEETHRFGKKLAITAASSEGVKKAVEAGADSIDWGLGLNEETNELLTTRDTFVVPALGGLDYAFRLGAQSGQYTGEQLNRLSRLHERIMPEFSDSFRQAYKAGVKIAMGSECNAGLALIAIQNYGLIHDIVDDAWWVLSAGTLNAAKMLGLEDQIGSLKVGNQADIVAMPGNPVENIRAVEEIDLVVKAGRVIRNDIR